MRVVLVTGGSEGIGLATAKAFVELGDKVIITGRNEQKLIDAWKSISEENCRYMVWDAADIEHIKANYKKAESFFGDIDVLVNNAGVLTSHDKTCDVLTVTPEVWDYTMDINLKSVYFMCQAAIEDMINKNIKGHIVNVGSENGFQLHAQTPYYISKWGVRAVTGGMGLFAAPHGITVNGVAPGATATKLSLDTPETPIEHPLIPRGRMALPEEIADTIVFMASDKACHIVGETILVTGGHDLRVPY